MESRKITSGIDILTTTRAQLARALKISAPRVTQLCQEGIFICDDTGAPFLVANIQNYERYKLRANSSGDELDYIRADQYRGVPYLAPVIETLKQLSRYTTAELTAAIIKSFFALFFVETPTGANISDAGDTNGDV